MNLDKAIIYAGTKAVELERKAKIVCSSEESKKIFPESYILGKYNAYRECAADYRQLASWLEELKCYRGITSSKNITLIIDGVNLKLSQGHIDALLNYEKEQTGEGVITKHMEIMKMLEERDRNK